MWALIIVPVFLSGRGNIREQLGYGVGEPWTSWSAIATGWGLWLVSIAVWIAIVRGTCGWIDRKLGKASN